jgi:hypothetical protein
MKSAHARYRGRLVALTDSRAIDDVLRDVTEASDWRRTKARFEPDEEPFATCVYESAEPPQRLVRVEVFTERAADRVPAGEAGWVRVTPFPSDPKLPALPALLAGPGRWTVVRYSPFRRCTLRVEQGGRMRFAKVFADARGERVHADGVELWRAEQRGELDFSVARPEGYSPSTRAVWQATVAGEPVAHRFDVGGEALALRIGRATASLSLARARLRTVIDADAALARAAGRCSELERRVPELAGDARDVLEKLARAHAAARPADPRPVHGALHPSQWLDDGSRLGLVDYDSVGLGDPELDAATFLADVDVENPERVATVRVNAAFLDGYESVAPIDHRLLRTYRAHGRLGRAAKAARALVPDGDAKAAGRLHSALECLGGAA